MSNEPLKAGDWVRAESGAVGQIIYVSRMSAFVDVQRDGTSHTMTFLLSELTKIEPPNKH